MLQVLVLKIAIETFEWKCNDLLQFLSSHSKLSCETPSPAFPLFRCLANQGSFVKVLTRGDSRGFSVSKAWRTLLKLAFASKNNCLEGTRMVCPMQDTNPRLYRRIRFGISIRRKTRPHFESDYASFVERQETVETEAGYL